MAPHGKIGAVIWSALDENDVRLPVVRDGNDAIVEIPSVGGWNGGYLLFEEGMLLEVGG